MGVPPPVPSGVPVSMGDHLGFLVVTALLLIVLGTSLHRMKKARAAAAELSRRLLAFERGEPSRASVGRYDGALGGLAGVADRVLPSVEEKLHRLERDRSRLRVVLGGMIEAVVAVDDRRRLLFANESAYRLFGLDDSAVGRLLSELIRSPQIQQVVDAALGSSEDHRGEVSIVAREGARVVNRTLEIHGSPFPGARSAGAVFVLHDVTELRRLERLRQDFVANVSHELKTPLASIKAFTETLLEGALHDPAVNEKFLRRIEEQADRLNTLIQDLLALARLESGDGVFDHAPLELRRGIATVVETHRERAETKGLAFVVELDALPGEVLVSADEEALRQVLDNLVDNAIKYTPTGGEVRITADALKGVAEFHVVDSGIGIPRDDLPRIFERFYRVDKARSRELGGTGLGLSIVKHLVQSMGGQVAVASRLGEGTRFTVRLPLLPAP